MPIGLVVWELATGHQKNVSTGRYRRFRFGLKATLLGIAAWGVLLAIWRSFEPSVAAGLSVGLFVGVPLLFLVVDDLFRRQKTVRDNLVGSQPTLDEDAIGESLDQGSALNAADGNQQSVSTKDKERKWWARRWGGMRLGRFGLWN